MATIFEEMHQTLKSIETKLGSNAGERINNATSNKKLNEKVPLDAQSAEQSFTRALNNSRLFQTMVRELSFLRHIVESISKVIGTNVAVRAALTPRGWTAAEIRAGKQDPNRQGLSVVHPGPQTIRDRFNETLQSLSKPSEFLKMQRKDWSEFMKKLHKNQSSTGRSGNAAASNAGGVAEGAEGLAAGEGAEGAAEGVAAGGVEAGGVLAGVAVIAVAVPLIGAALAKLALTIVDSQKRIAGYNATMAYAFAKSDISDILRDIRSANYSGAFGSKADAVAGVLDEWTEFKDRFQPIKDFLLTALLRIGQGMLWVANRFLAVGEYITKIFQAIPVKIIQLFILIKDAVIYAIQDLANKVVVIFNAIISAYTLGKGPQIGVPFPNNNIDNVKKAWADLIGPLPNNQAMNKAKTDDVIKKIKAACDAIIDAHKKDNGVVGVTAAQFMAGAVSTWNFGPKQNSRLHYLDPVWDATKNLK